MNHWPHSPIHMIRGSNTFMVTAATYKKQPFFKTEKRLQLLQDTIFQKCYDSGWNLQAWAILPNHYHLIALAPENTDSLTPLIKSIHGPTATIINKEDKSPGRKIWFQYWDSAITYESSYHSRLRYVHYNPVHHGIIDNALKYKWCSASWFERHATRSFVNTILGYKTDLLQIPDDF